MKNSGFFGSRFKQLLAALGLQATTTKSLELSSLRPGAATWLLTVAENAELTRRRGGWISPKVMEIYVQETSAARFMVDFTPKQRDCIFSLANFFWRFLTNASNSNVQQSQQRYGLDFLPICHDARKMRVWGKYGWFSLMAMTHQLYLPKRRWLKIERFEFFYIHNI